MDGTILGKGTFTSTGSAVTIAVPSGTDVLEVYNMTQAAASASTNGVYYYWDPNMGNNSIVYSNGTANALTVGVTTGGFTTYNPNSPTTYALNSGSTGISAWSNATPPVATVGSTAGMSAGYVVRFTSLTGIASSNQVLAGYNSMDFSVGYGTFTGTTFSVDYLGAAGGAVSTVSGNFRVIGFPITTSNGLGVITTDGLFYPRRRFITKMASSGTSTVITLSVQHNFTVGEEIRLSLPGGSAIWGSWAALDNYTNPTGQAASTTPNSWIITAVDTATGTGHNTITINANSTGFTTWVYTGASASAPFPAGNSLYTQAQVIPFGDDTATAISQNPPLSSLEDAVQNVGFLGVTLAGGTGVSAPAGQSGDVIYWRSSKCTFGGL